MSAANDSKAAKAKSKTVLLTANDLLDGEIVYLAQSGGWTRKLREARRIDDPAEAQAALAAALAAEQEVVGPELAEIAEDADPAAPSFAHLRDSIRSEGPTTHLALGRSTGR